MKTYNLGGRQKGFNKKVFPYNFKNADAILVVNIDKKGIKNYIGGNAFLEIGFTHILDKRILIK
ncbi:MAG TPA: hypothetical protein PLL80_01600 [Candidatus Pacearchaeota archaeon]|nr:hypothetical protein [Candidatus Pacearchaeota archaeon]HOK94330.1 hypothetical protein [Candidatus Pacearchaeota archaeon]HPO75281.1 hypothetical protein [Candidatus Pacearchaeota archaeon]